MVSVDKPVLAGAVSADLLKDRPGLELVLGTDDGTLICLSNKPEAFTNRCGRKNATSFVSLDKSKTTRRLVQMVSTPARPTLMVSIK